MNEEPTPTGPSRATLGGWLSRPSIVLRLGASIAAIALLAAMSILASIAIAEMSSGEARAINMAGSLRMQAYAVEIAAAGAAAGPDAGAGLSHAVAEFEARMSSRALGEAIPADADDGRQQAYAAVRDYWQARFKPLAQGTAAEAGLRLGTAKDELVARIDHLVVLIEQGLERKMQVLWASQGISLLLLLLVGGATVSQLRAKVVAPLRELLDSARRVRRGDFTARVQPREGDELGQLGDAFNFMVQDLSGVYAGLETRVKQKTAELARSNRSLELLYGTTRALSERSAARETLADVLAAVEKATGMAGGAIVQAGGAGVSPGVLAADLPAGLAAHVAEIAEVADQAGATRPATASTRAYRLPVAPPHVDAPVDAVCVPLADGAARHGVMVLLPAPAAAVSDWHLELLETVGRHVAAALSVARRNEERHRLALMEERSVIARELHDSLAQSLSFLKIQVTRLNKQLPPEPALEPAREVVRELREGLHAAYRQLRELLTTFRLSMDGHGFSDALRLAVLESTRRAGLRVTLDNRLADIDLVASQEIHVLQIVREALSNIEHHANARAVAVSLVRDGAGIHVHVDDDGVGIASGSPPANRYGLAIMRDRALGLGGTLRVQPRPGGGTRVALNFPARDARAEAAPHPHGSPA